MNHFDFGQVVLLKFPFTDGRKSKKRPAVVIKDIGDDDLLLARITSQMSTSKYDLELVDWDSARLKLPSIIRTCKIASIEKTLVDRQLGKLSDSDLVKFKEKIRALVDNL